MFVTAHARLRSQFFPCLATQVENLWVLRDAPRKKPRKSEVIAFGVTPEEAVRQSKDAELGWHFMSHLSPRGERLDDIKAEYKALGYRALSTERFFIHPLHSIPEFRSLPEPVWVDEHLFSSVPQTVPQPRTYRDFTRTYGVWSSEGEIGWVDSVPVGTDFWVSGLYVWDEYRGRGFGKALMSSMLRHEASLGMKTAVLLASKAGAHVYERLGFEDIGTLQIFAPVTR